MNADIDDGKQKIENIAGIANFFRPIIRVIGDAGIFVSCDLIALHDPFDGAFPINYIFICFFRDISDRDFAIIIDGILLTFFLGNAPFSMVNNELSALMTMQSG